MDKKIFFVSGMHCNSCAQLIELDLEELQGIKSVKVNFVSQKAIVEFDESKLNAQQIVEAIKKTGYAAKQAE